MKRFPPYMIVAVCGILFLSAGMVIITADSTDSSAQPLPTVDLVTLTPTDIVSAPVEQPAQPVVQPTDVPPAAPVQPVVQPTEVVAAPVVVPTDVVQLAQPTDIVQPVQPTAVVGQPQSDSASAAQSIQVPQNAPVIVGGQVQAQPTEMLPLPATAMPLDTSGTVVSTPVVQQPGAPLGTLPPPSNVIATAENPVVVPNIVVPTVIVATMQPTVEIAPTLAVMTQVTGQIGAPMRADYSGIGVMLTLPDGRVLQTTTDSTGHFIFANLAPGSYRVDAGIAGYLSSQTTFTLTQGQNLALPLVSLVGGDTNFDNKIDLTDAALIAANFDTSSVITGADLNHDGVVDIRDLTAIGAYFGKTGPTPWNP